MIDCDLLNGFTELPATPTVKEAARKLAAWIRANPETWLEVRHISALYLALGGYPNDTLAPALRDALDIPTVRRGPFVVTWTAWRNGHTPEECAAALESVATAPAPTPATEKAPL